MADKFFKRAYKITESENDIFHSARILLDMGFLNCKTKDLEGAQQTWALSISLAEQANDWSTAAKAAKNRAILLSQSDNPQLWKSEIQRSITFFKRANDPDGLSRAIETLNYSQSDLLKTVLGFIYQG